MTQWQIQHAKARLSEVIEKAQIDGPQVLTKHGRARAVILSMDEFKALKAKQLPTMLETLLSGPKFDEFEVHRDADYCREIEL
jgi:prevent-host-death family protein